MPHIKLYESLSAELRSLFQFDYVGSRLILDSPVIRVLRIESENNYVGLNSTCLKVADLTVIQDDE